ncbi:hypothetical protein TI05_19185 [Achromatium sp. WMS3]|nr:hypothetical protein TI05_19185 [Achromatium sp. WMS3]
MNITFKYEHGHFSTSWDNTSAKVEKIIIGHLGCKLLGNLNRKGIPDNIKRIWDEKSVNTGFRWRNKEDSKKKLAEKLENAIDQLNQSRKV